MTSHTASHDDDFLAGRQLSLDHRKLGMGPMPIGGSTAQYLGNASGSE